MKRHLMAPRSPHLSSVQRCGVCIMLLAAPLFLASSAYADMISIGFQEANVNSGNITTVKTGSGNLTVSNVSYGTFTVNDASVQDFTVLPTPGLLNSNVLDISTNKAGVLTIWITAQGIPFTGVPQNFTSSFAVNTLSGGIVQVTENTYFSPTNVIYNNPGQILLHSVIFGAIGTSGPFSHVGAPTGIYSVTHQYVIFDTSGIAGSDNLTIDLSGTPIPEPASLALLGAGLLGIFALKFRR